MPSNADYVRVIESEPEAYGDRGSSHVKSTRRAWTASCSCGWHAGSGAGWAWFRTKRAANAAWEQHAHLPRTTDRSTSPNGRSATDE